MPDVTSPDRKKLERWIHLLVNPIGSSAAVPAAAAATAAAPDPNRVKRNLYLFMLCTGLMTGTYKSFLSVSRKAHDMKQKKFHPTRRVRGLGAAPSNASIIDELGVPKSLELALEPSTFAVGSAVEAQWQCRHEWDVRRAADEEVRKARLKIKNFRLQQKPAAVKAKLCSVHTNDVDCPKDQVKEKIGKCLDAQFNYLLTLAANYPASTHSTFVLWLNALSRIGKDACVNMKSIRNDHIMLLVGYLLYGEVKGPFEVNPREPLEPLHDTIASYITKKTATVDSKKKPTTTRSNAPPLNPVSDTIEAFMNTVPRIDEGAFALLTISGNFFNQWYLSLWPPHHPLYYAALCVSSMADHER